MKRIRAIICDVGGVVEHCNTVLWAQQMARLYQTDFAIMKALWDRTHIGTENEPVTHRFGRGVITESQLQDALAKRFGVRPSHVEFRRTWLSALAGNNHDVMGLIDGVRKEHGLKLVACTDVDAIYHEHTRAPGHPLHRFFDDEAASHQIGALKPEVGMYRTALDHAGVDPDECIFIDDREENAAGAAKFGFVAHRFTSFLLLRRFLMSHDLLL